MKWIGQHIYDLVSRFRNDVYLESVSESAQDHVVGIDANGKLYKQDVTTGDITGVRLTTDDTNTASDSSGSVDFTIAGGLGIDTSTSGTTITIAGEEATASNAGVVELATTAETTTGTDTARAVTPDGLKDGYQGSSNIATVGIIGAGEWRGTAITTTYTAAKVTSIVAGDGIDVSGATGDVTVTAETATASNPGVVELATTAETTTGTDTGRAVTPDGLKDGYQGSANVTTLGTIATGTWEGTAIASDQQKHVMHYQTTGYATGDGTNYEISKQISANTAPFQHDVSIGSDGLTAQTPQQWMRTQGHVMPRACTLKRWTGWAASAGSGTTYIGLFKVTMTRDDSNSVSAVLLEEFSYTALGNNKNEDFDETSFTETAIAAGDIVFTAMKGVNAKAMYFNGTFEVEF
tara:strand:+ start:500 stop:1720 length:1221 start_codon:yes stop_codon:yes gene_type:complete